MQVNVLLRADNLRRAIAVFGGKSELHTFTNLADLVQGTLTGSAHSVFIQPAPDEESSMEDALRIIRVGRPDVRIVTYHRLNPVMSRAVTASAAVAPTAAFFSDSEPFELAAKFVAGLPEGIAIAREVLVAAGTLLSPQAVELLRPELELPKPMRHASQMPALRWHRNTIASRFRAAGLPTPRDVTAWSVILAGTYYGETYRYSVERVAHEYLRFTPNGYRNLLKRKLGVPPRTIMSMGGFRYVCQLFVRLLAARNTN